MNIVSLSAENILRLSAIYIKCDGKNVTLTGENASGKTSVLKCIEIAMGGERAIPEEPIHRGAKKGKVELDLGDFIVKRTLTEGGGGTLTVSSKDGAKYPRPQDILDGLIGKLTFDPLAFTRLKPKDQAETLRKLVGIDFSEIDKEYRATFDQRTNINCVVAEKKTLLQSQAEFRDVPAEEVTVSDILGEISKAQNHNAQRSTLVAAATNADDTFKARAGIRDKLKTRISELRQELVEMEADLVLVVADVNSLDSLADQAQAAVDAFKPIDVAPLTAKLSGIEETNRKVRQNKAGAEIKADLNHKLAEAADLTQRLDRLDAEKQKILESAEFPVPGLSFTPEGVLYNGLPFEQASSAEQLRVSAAMGMALNPKLRVLMIRDASLIDSNGMKALVELASEKGFQLWLERVGDGKEVKVVIEEGEST